MYAPSFEYCRSTKEVWHIVNPLHLAKAICSGATVVNCTKVSEELPEGVYLCKRCRRTNTICR